METKIYLAPMSGVTDLSFRLISREFGAGQCFFEMLDAKALIYGHPRNRQFLKTLKKDRSIAAQLLGADPSVMLDAAQKLTALADISFLDINSACPAKKVIKKGAGAALLKDTVRLGRIVKALADRLAVPVTVKLRTAFKAGDTEECVKTARICRENGASTVFIHGRTAAQGYCGGVDYGSIKTVKEALDIPVFGSGNIFSPETAGKMLDETGCDGILVARGAMGNPWIFRDIADYLNFGKVAKDPGLLAKKKTLKKHLFYVEKYKDINPRDKIGFMGKVAMWYLKGIRNAKKIREKINNAKSYKELLGIIKKAS